MGRNFDILLAGLKINIESEYDFMYGFCKKYITDSTDPADFYVKSSNEAILKEKAAVGSATVESCESLCVYRDIAERLPTFNRFVFHGAAIECDGDGYVFTAPSGTGKTTHICLWRKYLGDKVGIINGDKPIIKIQNGVTVYGTPWSGKENLHRNTSAPLKAVCVLKQGTTNKISRIDNKDAVSYLMRQIYLPQSANQLQKTLELLGTLIESIPVYLLECDISEQAFEVSYNTLKNI